MPSLIDNTSPVDHRDTRYADLFNRLQGNILKGHGRNFTANIFLQFGTQGRALKDTLRWLTQTYVRSAYDQLDERERFLHARALGQRHQHSMFGSLLLTKRTYEKLGFSESLNAWFPDPPDPAPSSPRQSNFLSGMRAAAQDLGDELTEASAVDDLERAYLRQHIDALLILADNSETHLLDVARDLVTTLRSTHGATTVAFEVGRVLRNIPDGPGLEHFGYVDGISQPLFLTSDFGPTNNSGSRDRWDPFAPLSLVLLPDPGMENRVTDAFGSYYVFRKLEQNVRAFYDAEDLVRRELGLADADQARAGAMIVGRFRDGTPLAMSGRDGFSPAHANDFRYDGLRADLSPDLSGRSDRLGLKCPFHAHIRKTNPRQSQDSLTSTSSAITAREREERARAIVRRGIPYGERTPENRPTEGVGLLFGCFQRSIMRQFAFIQRKWANTSSFKIPGRSVHGGTGLDPVIGQGPGAGQFSQHWRKPYGGRLGFQEPEELENLPLTASHPTAVMVNGLVKFRGGEFFFAPSLPFLRGE